MDSLNSSMYSLNFGSDTKQNIYNSHKRIKPSSSSSSSSPSSLSSLQYQSLQPLPVHYYYSPEPLSPSYHFLYHYTSSYFAPIPSTPSPSLSSYLSSPTSSYFVNNMTSTFPTNILNNNDSLNNDTDHPLRQGQPSDSSPSLASSLSSTYTTSSIEYYDDSYPLEDQDDDLEIILTGDSSMYSNNMFSANSCNNNTSDCSGNNSDSDKPIHEPLGYHNNNDEKQPNCLQRQLEYYFSRHNLANDIYLVSQMDIDLYVPITLIANFHRVQQYTNDLNEIIQILKRSSCVIVDETETKVKPNISPSVERTTVILRELPKETTKKEIAELLHKLNSPPVKSIKYDFGNIWYITFDSENDALKLFHDIRGCLFKEKPVAARMKSVPSIHNLFESVSHRQKQQQGTCLVSNNNYEKEYGNEWKNDNVDNNNVQNFATKRRRRRGGKKSKRYREHRQRQQQVANLKSANNENGSASIITKDSNADSNTTSTSQELDVITYASIVKRQTIQQ